MVYDVIGIGLGPFNLGMAALLDDVEDINALFFDQKPQFNWHEGLLIEGTTLQVPFLADTVSMVKPTSNYSFLNYLHHQKRLYHFYFLESFHIPRREYNHYLQWIAAELESCRFGKRVTDVAYENEVYNVFVEDVLTGETEKYASRHVVLGMGSAPYLPQWTAKGNVESIFHSAEFLHRKEEGLKADSITIIGSGQSAAEIFLELLKEQKEQGYELNWLTRSQGFFPMEYSKLGLEHFSPDYTEYFYGLPQELKDTIVPNQDSLYKGISADTIASIYDLLYERTIAGKKPDVHLLAKTAVSDITLDGTDLLVQCHQWEQGESFDLHSDLVIAATGYETVWPRAFSNLSNLMKWDSKNRPIISKDYEVELLEKSINKIFIQNGEMHTHGVGAPDLGLGAYRNAKIINQIAGKEVYELPEKNVFQHFGAGHIVRSKLTV
ncbi:lysine N(6)-hydroxylase/L-ornithine N(5)-oxygenase family protein [Metabacillus idriensis]|uniref:lysine N(6)-hydroxylase/L-ornithine N(5)-oxygenase family protein n=1 Tax=Metabacillus idriensis TaxID=324768 RepID=UPI001CD7B5C1|nr:lysine N(6)-hydroxylase/L-ornithine N(5)-oxygenase family protein [Metabacillus idriensis]